MKHETADEQLAGPTNRRESLPPSRRRNRKVHTVEFVLHPQLEADTIKIADLRLSSVLLTNDRRFPWIILVPRVAEAQDTIDLSHQNQMILTEEIAAASHALRAHFKPDKLNVAALGNMVPQLHVHVIARFKSDSAWPAPIWGVGTTEPYGLEKAQRLAESLANALGISA